MQPQNKILKDYVKLRQLYESGVVFTAFDTETTALSPNEGRIIEIGAVKFNKDGIISTYSKLFNPHIFIPQFIEDLTHISNEMVKDCPLIENELPDFMDFISNTILIGHNVQFDLNWLNAECINSNLHPSTNKAIDSLQYSIWAMPELEKHKLEFLADYFKIDKGSSHRAFDDANTCMELFKRLIYTKRPSRKMIKKLNAQKKA